MTNIKTKMIKPSHTFTQISSSHS